VPWIKWSNQYRLRSLLVAASLFAVILGLIAVATRWL
jgi:hypothetical protein